MLYQPKEILNRLKYQYKESLKNHCEFQFSEYTNINQKILGADFIDLNIKNIGQFLNHSTPTLFFSDELISVEYGGFRSEALVDMLESLKAQDFFDLYLKNKNLKVVQKVKEKGPQRQDFEKNMNLLANDYAYLMNKKIERVLGEKVKENVIYLVQCLDHESEIVFDGINYVASGNSWDFHPGCHGLSKYKSIKLGNWNGSGSLASILSNGLKKKVRTLEVSRDDYELFMGNGITFSEPDDVIDKNVTLYDLEREEIQNKEKLMNDKFDKLKKNKTTIDEMISILEYKYGKGIFTKGTHGKSEIIEIKYGYFYSPNSGRIDKDFEEFVWTCKGWYVEIMDMESISIMRI